MSDLEDVVGTVVKELNIRAFVGLGVGAGATILMRFAISKPEAVRGLILLGPSGTEATGSERDNYIWICRLIEWYGMSEYAKKGIVGLHYSTSAIKKGSSILKDYELALDGFNCHNVRKYIAAYQARPEITDNELKKLTRSVPTLLLASNGAGGGLPLMNGVDRVSAVEKLVERAEKLNSAGDSGLEWLEIPKDKSGHLVTEERPDELRMPISLFMQRLGFLVQ